MEHLRDPFALAGAHRGHRIERLAEQRAGRAEQWLDVDVGLLHDAGPAQQVERVQRCEVAYCRRHFTDSPADKRNEFVIQLQFGLLIERATEVEHAVDLATVQDRSDLLAKHLLAGPQFVGHAKLHVEIAVIDGAQLPRQRADLRLGGLSRKACHTV